MRALASDSRVVDSLCKSYKDAKYDIVDNLEDEFGYDW